MVCVIVKATKFYASLESLGQSRPHLLEANNLVNLSRVSVYLDMIRLLESI